MTVTKLIVKSHGNRKGWHLITNEQSIIVTRFKININVYYNKSREDRETAVYRNSTGSRGGGEGEAISHTSSRHNAKTISKKIPYGKAYRQR